MLGFKGEKVLEFPTVKSNNFLNVKTKKWTNGRFSDVQDATFN